MARISVPRPDGIREYIRPRYISWPVSNLLLYLVVIWNLEEVVVDPGQGGTIAVYIWPTYWASYHLQDVMFGALPEYTWSSLVLNYVFGIVPLYVATNLSINAVLPENHRKWRPSFSAYSWGGILFFLLITYIPVHLFGFVGIVLWFITGATSIVTAVWSRAPGYLPW